MSMSDKSILHMCISPREAWDAVFAWYAPQTSVAKRYLCRCLRGFKITPESNRLEEMGRMEDLGTEMHTPGLAFDNHMLYIIFVDALPCRVRGGVTESGISCQHRPRGYQQGYENAASPTFWQQEEGVKLWACPVRRRPCRWRPRKRSKPRQRKRLTTGK